MNKENSWRATLKKTATMQQIAEAASTTIAVMETDDLDTTTWNGRAALLEWGRRWCVAGHPVPPRDMNDARALLDLADRTSLEVKLIKEYLAPKGKDDEGLAILQKAVKNYRTRTGKSEKHELLPNFYKWQWDRFTG